MKPTRALKRPDLRGARLAGFAAARPSKTITGDELVNRFGKDADWLQTRTGIEQLHRLGPNESLTDLAETAAREALKHVQQTADLILVATCSQPNGFGEEVGRRLNTPTMTINAACSGFVFALNAAADQVRTSQADTVLVIGAEQMSAMVDSNDLGTSILFADGAGAAVVTATDSEHDAFEPAEFFSDGTARNVLYIEEGSTTLHMDGSAVFRWAVETVPELIKKALYRAKLDATDIEVFVPHQANLRITERIRKAAGLEHAITADDVRIAGNTSAASIPMALTALREREDIKGKLALLVGFGAGLSAAAQVVRLPS